MPLKKCPKCFKAVAEQLERCPYCGYSFFNAQNHYGSVSEGRKGCHIILTEYRGNRLHAKRVLSEVIDSTLSESDEILRSLPYTLYDNISENNAKRLCRQLRDIGISCELIDNEGRKEVYSPSLLQGIISPKPIRKKKSAPADPPLPFVRPKGMEKKL